MDEIDIQIVRELGEDGRRSFRSISHNLSIPEATVRFRVNRLIGNRILTIFGFVDWTRLSNHSVADIFLEIERQKIEDAINELKNYEEVQYIASTIGFCDVYIQVVFGNNKKLQEFLSTVLPKIPGFINSQNLMELTVHKATNFRQ